MPGAITSDFVALQTALAGRYSLDRELGRGGMGIVYLAHEVALDRPVALKLLPPHLAADATVRERFKQEARTAAKLSHPNIVPIFAVDEVDGFVFYAMAFVEGVTLGERVQARGPLKDSEATKLLREVAWALGYAHAQGVVHRDVKPDNILIEEGTGRALVMDFGIAQVDTGTAAGEGGASDRVIGTAEFMSPEQAKGLLVDHRSDLYSLGAVGFYALAGRAPFEDPSARAVLARHVTEPAPPLSSVAPSVPTPLAHVVDRCLRKEPERRWADGGSIADALAREAAADRPLPVPLRVFIKHLREMARTSGPAAVVLVMLVFPWLGTLLLFSGGGTAAMGLVLASIAGVGLGHLLYRIRKVLKAGHTPEDVLLALQQDVIQRNEEFRFDVGERRTLVDKVASVISVAGLGGAAVAFSLGGLGVAAAWPVGVASITAGLGSIAFRSARARRRADVVGEQWLKLLGGRLGKTLFKLGGWGLDPQRVLGAGTYRPTEMAISISAARLFEELPKDVRKTLAGLPDTVSKLEADARMLRGQIGELDEVLHEIGDDPTGPGADVRAKAFADVQTTRDAAAQRLKEVVTALETIRLGLLRMHAGEKVVQSVTTELRSARELSGDLGYLLEGHREVERMLAERRATGVLPAFEG